MVWGLLTGVLMVCLIMQYLSYFLTYLDKSGSKQLMEWIDLSMFIFGWRGYMKNRLGDVYGYYLLLALIAIERLIAKRLKLALKREIVSFHMGGLDTVPDN